MEEVKEEEEVKEKEDANAEAPRAQRSRTNADFRLRRGELGLNFKIHINTGVIGLSRVYFIGIRMSCGKEFERDTRNFLPETAATAIGLESRSGIGVAVRDFLEVGLEVCLCASGLVLEG